MRAADVLVVVLAGLVALQTKRLNDAGHSSTQQPPQEQAQERAQAQAQPPQTAQLEADVASANERANALSAMLDSALHDKGVLSGACSAEIQALQERAHNAEGVAKQLHDTLALLAAAKQKAEEAALSLAQEVSDKASDIEGMQAVVSDLQSAHADLLRRKDGLVEELQAREDALNTTRSDLARCRGSLDTSGGRVVELEKEKGELEAAIAQQAVIASHLASSHSSHADDLDVVQRELGDLRATVETLNNALESQVKEAENKEAVLQAIINNLERKLDDAEGCDTDASQSAALRDKLRAKSEHVDALVEELSRDREEREKLFSLLQRNQQDKTELAERANGLQSQLAAATGDLQEAQARLAQCA